MDFKLFYYVKAAAAAAMAIFSNETTQHNMEMLIAAQRLCN